MSEIIYQAINRHFKKYRLIFWYDDNGNNRNPNEEKIKTENNEFWIKYRVLKEEHSKKFLNNIQ